MSRAETAEVQAAPLEILPKAAAAISISYEGPLIRDEAISKEIAM